MRLPRIDDATRIVQELDSGFCGKNYPLGRAGEGLSSG
jgi:hypothetical protein